MQHQCMDTKYYWTTKQKPDLHSKLEWTTTRTTYLRITEQYNYKHTLCTNSYGLASSLQCQLVTR